MAEASAHPGADDVVFKSTAHDASPMTYHGGPTKTASSHISIKTLHHDKGKLHKHDVVIRIPDDVAHFMEHMLKKSDTCKAKSHHPKRQPHLEAHQVDDTLHWLFHEAGGALPVAQFEPVHNPHQDVPQLPMNRLDVNHAEHHVEELRLWVQYEPIDALAVLDAAMLLLELQLMWIYTYHFCILGATHLKRIILSRRHHGQDDDCPADAPKGKHAPLCRDCDGADDVICRRGEWKGCHCILISTPIIYPDISHLWHEKQRAIKALLEPKHGMPDTHCDPKNKVGVESDAFREAYDKFCSWHGPNVWDGKEITRGGHVFELKHKWYHDKCPKPGWDWPDYRAQCYKTFKKFFDNTECIYSSHLMAKSGHYHSDCSVSSFKIKPAPPHHHHHHHHHPRGEGPMHCHKAEGCYNEVNSEDHVRTQASAWCYRLRKGLIKGRILKPGDHQVNYDLRGLEGTNFFARWIDGCKSEKSHDIAGGDCEDIYAATFFNCNNGGRGGWHREGCVAMGMHPVCGGTT